MTKKNGSLQTERERSRRRETLNGDSGTFHGAKGDDLDRSRGGKKERNGAAKEYTELITKREQRKWSAIIKIKKEKHVRNQGARKRREEVGCKIRSDLLIDPR